VLLDGVKEEPLNAALMKHDLLEPTDARDSIRNTIRSTDNAVLVGVPEADLHHVVRFSPGAVGKVKGIKDLQCPALKPVCLAAEYLRKASISFSMEIKWTNLCATLVHNASLDS
jgi:hypothetical protein